MLGESPIAVFFPWFVATGVRKVGSLKPRVRMQLFRNELKNGTLLWREPHFLKSKYTKHLRVGPPHPQLSCNVLLFFASHPRPYFSCDIFFALPLILGLPLAIFFFLCLSSSAFLRSFLVAPNHQIHRRRHGCRKSSASSRGWHGPEPMIAPTNPSHS